jgi:hypothetical protein
VVGVVLVAWLASVEKADRAKDTVRREGELRAEITRSAELLNQARREADGVTTLAHKTIAKVAQRLVKDAVKNASDRLTGSNYATMKSRLQALFEFCSKNGYQVPAEEQQKALDNLRVEYELEVRREIEREEQARIKARIREEQREEKEREAELKRIEGERATIAKALEAALRQSTDKHSLEIEALRQKLAEAEAKAFRAKSQAELTRAGYVYVISNVGSFGEDVYKVGMTRRLEPMERVKELGDASVPFSFDVHMMISCNDAPTLENALHRELHANRLNRVNLRKEFFRVGLDQIRNVVERHHGNVEYVADAEALEYRESSAMTSADFTMSSRLRASEAA